MKTNTELQATLNVVMARLEAEPKDHENWEQIAFHLREATAYAEKVARLRKMLESGPASFAKEER